MTMSSWLLHSLLFVIFTVWYSTGLIFFTVALTEFDFGTLTLSILKILGNAHFSNGSMSLTCDLGVPNSGAGRVLYSNPVHFKQPSTPFRTSFSTFFSFSVSNLNPSSIGSDFVFIISPDNELVGAAGAFLGLQTVERPESDSGSGSFVAVEFDTLMDVEFKDINSNHVGLDLNSMVSTRVGNLGAADIDLKRATTSSTSRSTTTGRVGSSTSPSPTPISNPETRYCLSLSSSIITSGFLVDSGKYGDSLSIRFRPPGEHHHRIRRLR